MPPTRQTAMPMTETKTVSSHQETLQSAAVKSDDSRSTQKDSKVRPAADFNKNNLDCLRLMLASTVALFHFRALSELPALSSFDRFLSAPFAVRSFFVISGLLIFRSYTRSSSVSSYFEKRVRRIYPAYFTVIVVAAIALCTLSTVPISHYFGFGFWKYLGANLLFLNFLAPSLPGVFQSNSITAVNGALWTLKIEAVFYLSVPIIHYLCKRLGTKQVMLAIFSLSCLWKYGFAYLATRGASHGLFSLDSSRNIYSQLEVQFPAQLAYFTAGILLLLYFDKLKHHSLAISVITACLYLVDHFYTHGILDIFWISGLVFVIGFWRYLGNFSKYGDFSYGVYIVHWPIIQTLIVFGAAKLNPALFLMIGISLITLTAFLMWHLVENRFLASSSHYRQASVKAPA
jgi:peptidoglycan/LPS O-acetylase OafA/YrhL